MGFFWKSDSDYIIEDIQELVGQINQKLTTLQESLVANNGPSDENIVLIGNIFEQMAPLQNQVEDKFNQLSSSKQSKVMVPWVDGRYFPFAMWAMSYNMYIRRIQAGIKKYANNI